MRGWTIAAAILLSPAAAQAAGPFDGRWNVVLTCPAAADGVLGYTYRFDATVADSIFRGQNSVAGAPGFLVVEGPIRPDGTSDLLAHGTTGDPSYAVGRPGRLTPYQYPVRARFAANSGSGERAAVRQCTLSFEKYR